MWIQYLAFAITTVGFSLIVKPWVLIKEIDYTVKEIWQCYLTCIKTFLLAFLISTIPMCLLTDSISHSIIKVVTSWLSVCISSYLFMDKQTKDKLRMLIVSRFSSLK